MPRAVPLPLRERVVHLCQRGDALRQVAQETGLRYRTVCRLWRRFRTAGLPGLQSQYAACGRSGNRFPAPLHQAALALKREHRRWGGELIRLRLREQFPAQALPSCRTLQRWFAVAGLQPARSRRPSVHRERGREPHAVWEVDAKERLRLGNGAGASILTVTDEATGALLEASVFPPVSLEAGASDRCAGGVAAVVCPLGPAATDPGG